MRLVDGAPVEARWRPAIETVLDSVVAQRTRIAGERQSLEARNVMLEARLKQMQIAQADVLGRMGQRTLGDIAEVERVVAMTGLDADTMLNRSGSPRVGQGGERVVRQGSGRARGRGPGTV